MKRHRLPIRSGRRRGMMLAVTLVLMTLIALGSLWMTRTLLDQQRLNKRLRNFSRAFYAAEGGVALVIGWGNHPEDYTPNTNLFQFNGSTFPNLVAAIGGSGLMFDSDALHDLGIDTLSSKYSYDSARIKQVELLPPDPSHDPVSCLFKVRSTGWGADGVEKTILAYLQPNISLTTIQLPAALISNNIAAIGGNSRIHWGEAWSIHNFSMIARSQFTDLLGDSRAIYRTEGDIIFDSTWKETVHVTRAADQPGLDSYAPHFFQHLPAGSLVVPEFDYQTFKDIAVANGRYYSTDAAGNIYRGGIEDAAHRVVGFLAEFGVPNRATAPYDFTFVDTIDGQPPAADGSNLATINDSGNSLGLKGVYWIGANLAMGGAGTPPSAVGVDPDGNPHTLSKIFLDGVLYGAGTIDFAGNPGVYGSIVAMRGFIGGGTPDIYYNSALASGLEISHGNLGSILKIALFDANPPTS
ncbi:MAG: hypothetical protein M1457_06965 [bacterium]|nr:hypothetical protein [bacterium]